MDFIPHFAARGGIFPPCELGGLKIVRAGSAASKLLETQDMTNIGVDTGSEAQGSPAEFNKSSSRLALLLSAGLAVSKLPLLQGKPESAVCLSRSMPSALEMSLLFRTDDLAL